MYRITAVHWRNMVLCRIFRVFYWFGTQRIHPSSLRIQRKCRQFARPCCLECSEPQWNRIHNIQRQMVRWQLRSGPRRGDGGSTTVNMPVWPARIRRCVSMARLELLTEGWTSSSSANDDRSQISKIRAIKDCHYCLVSDIHKFLFPNIIL